MYRLDDFKFDELAVKVLSEEDISDIYGGGLQSISDRI